MAGFSHWVDAKRRAAKIEYSPYRDLYFSSFGIASICSLQVLLGRADINIDGEFEQYRIRAHSLASHARVTRELLDLRRGHQRATVTCACSRSIVSSSSSARRCAAWSARTTCSD